MSITESFFWFSVIGIFYTYFGYPLLLVMLTSLMSKAIKKAEITPSVSLVIAAYNEEKAIEEKIKNSLALDYPRDKLEIIVVSDGSTDKTNEIVQKFALQGVKLCIFSKRLGKTSCRNEAIKLTRGDILVFSDATGMYNKDVIKKLVRNFNDSRVGCVGGFLRYINPKNSMVGEGEGLYWRYEVMLRRKESRLGNLMAVSGAIYAIRKELYKFPPKELADDFISPLMVKKQGYYCVYETEAVCVEETVSKNKNEVSKRARIALRNIKGLFYMKTLFNFFKYGIFSLELFSHKILRLTVPVFLLFIVFANILLLNNAQIYKIIALMQVIFYSFALIGYILQRMQRKSRLFYIPFYFCVTNLGILFGIIRFLVGKEEMIWKPER